MCIDASQALLTSGAIQAERNLTIESSLRFLKTEQGGYYVTSLTSYYKLRVYKSL